MHVLKWLDEDLPANWCIRLYVPSGYTIV